MAITNAQQYQQLVNKPANGKRPGYRGDAAYGKDSGSEQARSIGQAKGQTGPGRKNESMGDGPASKGFEQLEQPGLQDPSVYGATGKQYNPDAALAAAVKVANEKPRGILNQIPSTINLTRSFINNIPFIKKQLEKNRIDFIKDQYPEYYDEEEGLVGLPANLQDLYDQGKLSSPQAQDILMNMTAGDMNFPDYMATVKGSPALLYSGNVGNLEKIKNPDGTFSYIERRGDGDGAMSDYERRLLALEQSMSPTTEPEVDPNSLAGLLANRMAYRFMADGGRAGFAGGGMPYEGGIMDLESARQMYGLGKLVKKATGAIKKIVKSPVGKAALLAGGAGLFGYGPAKELFASGKGLGFKDFLTRAFLGKEVSGGALAGRGRTGGIFQFMKDNPLLTIAGGSALAGLLSSSEDEDEVQPYYRGPGLDINAIRRDPYGTKGPAFGFYAKGGDVKEPVAKDTMPLLDMNGMEKDYRADGGFVPIGRMERADDVPARLSKNEFVFTADAVRNAGEGDIDKGAEVMYNVMKNLEAGGNISEESQGLNGARNMFQTSKRLEEVL